ncbi:MAG: hypothetical protein ACI9N1_003069 [Flavobacteriales bacterium]|jgi:hypothetical protein
MKVKLLLLGLVYTSLIGVAQNNWIKNFEIFVGFGNGNGSFDQEVNSIFKTNLINYNSAFLAVEYSDYLIPVSLEYDITSSNYTRKEQNFKTSSNYTTHKIGIGYKVKDEYPLKLKYILRSHYYDFFDKVNHGVHISGGIQSNIRFGDYLKSNRFNLTYRVMAYLEFTFGDLTRENQILTPIHKSPFRNIVGASIWIKPWRNKPNNHFSKDILPPL